MAFRAPLLGYNTNVRHAGKLYHIQTEDSGVDHPHVITHLFADGGRIVASKKTSYADRVGSEGLPDQVKKLMQGQHKAMFIALRDGVYDEGTTEDVEEQTGPRKLPPSVQQAIAAGVPLEEAPANSVEPSAPTNAESGATLPPARPASSSAVFKAPKADPKPEPSETVSLDAIEAQTLAEARNAGRVTANETVVSKTPSAPRSLFGAELLSDKSLDEVILNYLAANEKDG